MTSLSAFHRLRLVALAFCLFAFVVGSNWATFDRYGSDMPDWDQWDAEGLNLFAPWFEHDHFVAHLFQPHNEHRVVLTKLQNLTVGVIGGQWDSRVECLFNAALHGLIAVAFWVIGRRWLTARWHALYFLVIAALFGLPLAWQNLLGGFHSQQYWLIGLSFIAIVWLPFAITWRPGWWLAAGATTLALGSMGSGFLATVVVFGLVVWHLLQRQSTLRSVWPTLVLTIALIAVGDSTRVEVYYHQHLKAKTAHDFIFSILRSLEWPLRDHDWVGAVLWLPFLLVGWRFVRDRATRRSRAAQTILALGGWVLIQLLATAYARGAGADYPASRYMDTLIFAMALNGLAMGWLLSASEMRSGRPPRLPNSETAARQAQRPAATPQILVPIVGIVWLVTLSIGLHSLVVRNIWDELPGTKNYYVQTESHLLGFLATGDQSELTDPIPYPSASALVERLAHPSLRALMPASVRPSLPLGDAAENGGTFVLNRASQRTLDSAPREGLSPAAPALASRPTWGSFNAQGAANTGEWQSAPLKASLAGWLKFETAGNIGEPGIALELHDAATHSLLDTVRPKKIPGDTWRSAYVRAPRLPFVVVARDSDPQKWFAFSAPVEMSTLSYGAWQCMKNGLLIAVVAAGLAIVLAISSLVIRGEETSDSA